MVQTQVSLNDSISGATGYLLPVFQKCVACPAFPDVYLLFL